jgi:hypothetical protein
LSNATLTTVICTHNPRAEYLERTLSALRAQTLPLDQWELLVIDNASHTPVAPRFSISWHANARHVNERTLGLTSARLRGIAESSTELIVFVDDDNVLDADYLEKCLEVAAQHPCIGSWGGQCRPDFVDGAPAEWTRRYWPLLAVGILDGDHWTSRPEMDGLSVPFGAGLVVRREVANAYAELTRTCPHRLMLDRRGTDLASCGDSDLALTACDLGYGVGRFQRLALTHIMPGSRLTEPYLLNLVEAMFYSAKILNKVRGQPADEPCGPIRRIRLAAKLLVGRTTARDYRISLARVRGLARADRVFAESIGAGPLTSATAHSAAVIRGCYEHSPN